MRRIIPVLMLFVLVSACSSIDCPIENKVYCKYKLAGKVTQLSDTLSVDGLRPDEPNVVLLNREEDASEFSLPVSHVHAEDVLVLTLVNSASKASYDTIWLKKTNIPHFESVDCAPRYFHRIEKVTCTRHTLDSIIIKNSEITYDTTGGNILLYFKSGH